MELLGWELHNSLNNELDLTKQLTRTFLIVLNCLLKFCIKYNRRITNFHTRINKVLQSLFQGGRGTY